MDVMGDPNGNRKAHHQGSTVKEYHCVLVHLSLLSRPAISHGRDTGA